MIYGPLSELLGRRYCRKAGWSAAGLLWGPLSCEVVAGFQSHEATPHHAPQLPVCLGHCEVHTSSPATTVAEPRVGRRPHHCSCLCPPADQHKQTCRSPFGIHHAHPVHTQACLSQLSPLIATPPPRGRNGCLYWALEETARDRWGAAQSHTPGEPAPTPSPSGQETTYQNLHGTDRWACAGRASIAQTGPLSCKAPSGVLLAEKIWHVQLQRCCARWGPRPMSRLPQALWTLTRSPGTDCSEPRQNTQGT